MKKVGIVGGTGYTGVELLRLLAGHSDVNVNVVTSRGEAGKAVADIYQNLRGHFDLSFVEPDIDALGECDLVFFATPNGAAMKMVPSLLDKGAKIIDLAADFRIKDIAVWEKWYGMSHACPQLVEDAVYGMPEMNRDAIISAQLVANPGCYVTASTLGFLPLIEAGIIEPDHLIADCKSGVSGAGRGASVGMLMGEVGESFKAYGVSGHRHLPEIEQNLQTLSSLPVVLTFVPHLVPMIRGIETTLYGRLTQERDLQQLFEDRYQSEPFVDVLPEDALPETRNVRGGEYLSNCSISTPG